MCSIRVELFIWPMDLIGLLDALSLAICCSLLAGSMTAWGSQAAALFDVSESEQRSIRAGGEAVPITNGGTVLVRRHKC